jgi:hypothetical protein
VKFLWEYLQIYAEISPRAIAEYYYAADIEGKNVRFA